MTEGTATRHEWGWRLPLTLSLFAHLTFAASLAVLCGREDLRVIGASVPIVVELVPDAGGKGEAMDRGSAHGGVRPVAETTHGVPQKRVAAEPVRVKAEKAAPESEAKPEMPEEQASQEAVPSIVEALSSSELTGSAPGTESRGPLQSAQAANAAGAQQSASHATAGGSALESIEAPSDNSPGLAIPAIEPEYPRRSRESGEEGTVVLRVSAVSGRRSIEIIKSSGYRRLDKAAATAVEEGFAGWKAASFSRTVHVKFKLKD